MRFNPQTRRKAMGPIERAYLAFAADEQVRNGAASGGAVTALLLHLLDTRQIGAALVTHIRSASGRIEPKVVLATTREEVLGARTSKYFDVPLLAEGLPLVRGFDGCVAVVGLPCHAAALRKLAARDGQIASRLRCIIALFCNHSCDRYLLDRVLAGSGVDQSKVAEFWFRRGHWRGRMGGRLTDGREFAFPFRRFSEYHNLHMFCLPRCLHCHDHMGCAADFSAGDAWLREMRRQPMKHSIILSRNVPAEQVLQEVIRAGKLVGCQIDEETVFRSQKRSLIYHYNVTARARAAARWGMRIADAVGAPVGWNDALAAWLILLNHRWSHDPVRRDWIFRIPRPVITAYFLFLKFLQSF